MTTRETSYWGRKSLSRRRALQLGAGVGSIASLSLIGCSSDKEPSNGGSASATNDRDKKLDATKGVQGGTLKFHASTEWNNLNLVAARNPTVGRFWSLTNNGLLRLAGGQWGYDPGDPSLEPDLATAMPEQPDAITLTYKLRPGVQFHNGRALTAEDVKYSYEVFAKAPAYAVLWSWLDHIETPDAQTVMFKMKNPNVDAMNQTSGYYNNVIAREVQESSKVNDALMGTGPYKLADFVTNISARFERNPNYHLKPLPYFDSIESYLGTVDSKRLVDVQSRQVDLPFWFGYAERDQLKQSRPDMSVVVNSHPSYLLTMRTDKPPYNDVRVRKALSLSIDRDKINKGVFNGEGHTDTPFGTGQKYWGARPADQLPGALPKNFVYDIAEAKKLLAAAGVNGPIKDNYTHINAAGPGGQGFVDVATLAVTGWRENGIAEFTQTEVSSAVSGSTVSLGKYDGVAQALRPPGNLSYGTDLRDLYYADANGPVQRNASHYSNPNLNSLLDKQQTQANLTERQKTFRQIEELLADELPYVTYVTFSISWFYPPKLQNARMSLIFGTATYFQKWWFA